MLRNGAFTALILIICGLFSDAVPPPSNVMVKCENLNITVSWDYSEHQPQTIFMVNVTGSRVAGSFEASTADHKYDLSRFVLGSQERYLSYLVVFVKAVQGGEQSEAVKSKSFSFNQLQTVDIKCLLDFPPVTVHKAEDGASVKFANPLRFYDELKSIVTPNSNAAVRFRVYPSEFIGSCGVSDLTCKLDVKLSAEECVTLKGDLCFHQCVDQIAFKETKKYCSEKQETYGLVMFAIILGTIFLIIIIVAVVVICKVEAWTVKILVPNIQVNSQGNGEQRSFFIPNPEPKNSRVSIASPPVETTSLVSEDQNFCEQPEPNNGDGGDYDCRGEENYAGGGCLEDSNPNLDTEGFVSGANGTDDDSPDGSVKTECISISSTEEERSPYDRPHVYFQRELGDGEPVTGYGGN
ncbi:interferon gamma receptor 1 precursor [Poecilia reticulata]|uniref:Interferon gamma receptor 1 n=1 Tax=Poecilia reticulata TaxID=8081 RepID=A0A3P9QAA7_POERE|nr:interferon gamma receptor 1 precursor [Poecilia reticulata]